MINFWQDRKSMINFLLNQNQTWSMFLSKILKKYEILCEMNIKIYLIRSVLKNKDVLFFLFGQIYDSLAVKSPKIAELSPKKIQSTY